MAPSAAFKAEETPTESFSVDYSCAAPLRATKTASTARSRRSPLRALAEALSTDSYELIEEKSAKSVFTSPILITDGDLNFGITSKGGLKSLIEEKKISNLFLSVIGTGLYNYKDDKLEVLAKHGNGTYCVVNDLEDVEVSINKRYIALTNIVAKDVKAQVEFNPRFVKNYRLLGYENRELNHEDFTNDSVISEPYGSGSHGVALYEL